MKRMRKAQRIRAEVARGQEDRSQVRVWAGIDISCLTTLLPEIEALVPDLDKDVPLSPPGNFFY